MAKDITVRVTGQNPDGSMNISVPDGTSNPFMQSSQTAMVPYNPSPQAQTVGYRARMGSVEVMFASEADFLKADKAFREQVQVANVPVVGGGGTGGGGNSMLRTGASIGEAAAAFYNGRAIRKRMDERSRHIQNRCGHWRRGLGCRYHGGKVGHGTGALRAAHLREVGRLR